MNRLFAHRREDGTRTYEIRERGCRPWSQRQSERLDSKRTMVLLGFGGACARRRDLERSAVLRPIGLKLVHVRVKNTLELIVVVRARTCSRDASSSERSINLTRGATHAHRLIVGISIGFDTAPQIADGLHTSGAGCEHRVSPHR